MNHTNLSNEINHNIAASEISGGIWLSMPQGEIAQKEAQEKGNVLAVGKGLRVKTKNTLYVIEKRGEDEFYISGSARFCPSPVKAYIAGSTWGGSMLKMGFVGRGMNLELSTDAHKNILTTTIQEITEFTL